MEGCVMESKTENITINVTGWLDDEFPIDFNSIELQLFKDKRVNTENWDGIPCGYQIGTIDVHHDNIDWMNYEERIEQNTLDDIVYDLVRDDLFSYVGDSNDNEQQYWYEPIKTEVK
jgi:hypothetical protein